MFVTIGMRILSECINEITEIMYSAKNTMLTKPFIAPNTFVKPCDTLERLSNVPMAEVLFAIHSMIFVGTAASKDRTVSIRNWTAYKAKTTRKLLVRFLLFTFDNSKTHESNKSGVIYPPKPKIMANSEMQTIGSRIPIISICSLVFFLFSPVF